MKKFEDLLVETAIKRMQKAAEAVKDSIKVPRKLDIELKVETDGDVVQVTSTDNAKIEKHEFGYLIPEKTIKAVNKQALHFTVNGEDVFAKSVHQNARIVPAEPFCREGISASSNTVKEILTTE